MQHSLARLFTFFAVLAVSVNAQCAVSCSLSPARDVKQEAHSCCKDHKVPASHQRQACPEPILTVANFHQSHTPHFYIASLERVRADLRFNGQVRIAATGLHVIPDHPTFSILRL